MSSLKGNLGVKSSPLAPTACKLSTQYLVLDHMTNHYNKIAKAKSAIDNKPPKSLSVSQKLRDRKSRESAMSPSRTRPVSSMSHREIEEYQDILNDEPENEEERLVHSIMRSTLGGKKASSDSHKATYNSEYQSQDEPWEKDTLINGHEQTNDFNGKEQSTWKRPLSVRSGLSTHSVASSIQRGARVPINHADHLKNTYNGDVLDKRAHYFTEPERPFTPRTLKTNHQSRLKNSKCYNAPKRTSVKQNGADPSLSQSYIKDEKEGRKSQPRQHIKLGKTDSFGETLPTSQLSESILIDMTLQSRNGHHAENEKREIPPLAIAMDVDHLNWLQEQASKAQVRARHSSRFKKNLKHKPSGDSQEKDDQTDPTSLNSSVRQETVKKEEEQKYLAFAKEVTDDVLASGISTDRVLDRVFESHIERRKEDLDEERMRVVVRDLKKDLGLAEHSMDRGGIGDSTLNSNEEKKERVLLSNGTDSEKFEPSGVKKFPFSNSNASNSNSNLSATLDSTSTMKFGQTGDMFSTIQSQDEIEEEQELSEGELRATRTEIEKDDENGLTDTQVLKQYQMNLTAKEAQGETNGEVSVSEAGPTGEEESAREVMEMSNSSDRPATGEQRDDQESSNNGQNTVNTFQTSMTVKSELTVSVNAAETTHSPSTDIVNTTPSSTTHYTNDLSPGTNHQNSQDTSQSERAAPRMKPRNRRRQKTSISSRSEANGSSSLKNGGGCSNGAVASNLSAGTTSERDMSDDGQKEQQLSGPRSRRRGRNENNKDKGSDSGSQTETVEEKNEPREEVDEINEEYYASDYEEDYETGSQRDTHRTSDDDF